MKTKIRKAVAQLVIGFSICVMAVYAMAEMFLSKSFLAVYDAAGDWHLLPQLTRYFLYIVLAAIAVYAALATYYGVKCLLRKAKELF